MEGGNGTDSPDLRVSEGPGGIFGDRLTAQT